MTKNVTLSRPVESVLERALNSMESGRIASEEMARVAKECVQGKYPGSKHWDPEKIHPGPYSREKGSVAVDIPGASRADHDVVIKPVRGQFLTIPLVQWAVGKKASDFPDLFRPWQKGGGRASVLCQRASDGELTAVFALARQAFQPKDPSLLPTAQQYLRAVIVKWCGAFAGRFG